MLAQKIFAVIVAVRRAHYDVDMILIGLLVLAERDAPLMVELDDDHRALDAIIKNAVVLHAAHPAKVGISQMALYFFHSYLSVVRPHPADVQLNQAKQQFMLRA
jgi:hypothetical protein